MSGRVRRVFARHKVEFFLTVGFFSLAIALVLLPFGPSGQTKLVQVGERLGFALIVAIIVRWTNVVFAAGEHAVASTDTEYHDAVRRAKERVWVCQTWLHGIDRDALEILNSNAADVRLLLGSFKPRSHMYPRIDARRIRESIAKGNVASSVAPFIERNKTDRVRFNHSHHPGWIAIVDTHVFWGPTPVHADNHSIDFLFHRHRLSSPDDAFWFTQFELLWDEYHSHKFSAELDHNEKLKELVNPTA
jgi:hypothetical protein